jgi:hypothetical protein
VAKVAASIDQPAEELFVFVADAGNLDVLRAPA